MLESAVSVLLACGADSDESVGPQTHPESLWAPRWPAIWTYGCTWSPIAMATPQDLPKAIQNLSAHCRQPPQAQFNVIPGTNSHKGGVVTHRARVKKPAALKAQFYVVPGTLCAVYRLAMPGAKGAV